MTPQQLRNSILQLAIQGKLVEQRQEEGTGEELYQQIQVEKQRLIKEGKLKKQKPLPEITEDEIPFGIPRNWLWTRLDSIVFNHGQTTPQNVFSYIDIGSIDNKRQRLNSEDQLIEPNKAPSRARKIVKYGDILYSTVRPYLHNMCIVDRQFGYTPIASTGFAVMACYDGVYNKFLFYYLMSPTFDNYANSAENSKGVAYPAINDKRLYLATIPIPPLAEQKRIVAKIEELLPHIDRYEKAWSKLEDLNKRFPEDMQKSILQEAIQGKLVEQRQEEGTGEELYQQIQAEKKKLIKEGKIKKEKPLPEITEDEKPFDIPESWKWTRLGGLIHLISGRDMASNTYNSASKGLPYITGASNIQDGKLVINRWTTQPETKAIKEDILLTCKGTIGKTIVLDESEVHIARQIMSIRVINCNSKYIQHFIDSYVPLLISKAKSMIPGIRRKDVLEAVVPLPPLKEQIRIVAKIEELLPLCEKLKSLG
jgi:type I restriction enzyme S subunit